MKSLSKWLKTLFTLLFFLGVAASAYMLYELPVYLMSYSTKIDLIQIRQLQPLLYQLYLVIGATLALGMLSILIFSVLGQKTSSKQATGQAEGQANIAQAHAAHESTSDHSQHWQIEGLDEAMNTEDEKHIIFNRLLSLVCKQLEASQAAAYEVKWEEEYRVIEMFASFAHHTAEGTSVVYRFGEGLAGQVAKEGKRLQVSSVPEGYIQIVSGLGKATPTHLLIIPVKADEEVVGVVEIASFKEISIGQETALQAAFDKLALKLANNDNVSLVEAKQ